MPAPTVVAQGAAFREEIDLLAPAGERLAHQPLRPAPAVERRRVDPIHACIERRLDGADGVAFILRPPVNAPLRCRADRRRADTDTSDLQIALAKPGPRKRHLPPPGAALAVSAAPGNRTAPARPPHPPLGQRSRWTLVQASYGIRLSCWQPCADALFSILRTGVAGHSLPSALHFQFRRFCLTGTWSLFLPALHCTERSGVLLHSDHRPRRGCDQFATVW